MLEVIGTHTLVGIRKEFTNKPGHLDSLCAIPIRKTVASLHLRDMSKKDKGRRNNPNKNVSLQSIYKNLPALEN